MSKHPLAIICALAFTVGAAAAGVLYYPLREETAVRGVAAHSPDAGGASDAESAAPARGPGEGVRSEETGPASDSEGEAAADTGGAAKRAAGVKGRPAAGRQSGRETRAATGYVRVSGGRSDSGGRRIAGHAVNGVKKTGEGVKKTGAAIGRTFGKIGGVFHD